MPHREPLSPLINSPHTPLRQQASSKHPSPSGSRHLGLINSPVSSFSGLEDQDEGKQKKELRRRSHGFELQRKNIGSPKTKSPATSDSFSGLTTGQLTSHYSDCIKLSAENKINSKNAFGLHLIDYMAVLVKKKELENFQVASSTLDASVKIYAGRVDFIHSHTYKVLSGLGGHQKPDGDENGDGHDVEGAEVPGVKKKRKTNKGRTTENNLKNINVDKFDLEFEVDPMFKMMSSAFDEGGAKGLLLNRLRNFDENQLLVLDSSTPVNVVEDAQESDSKWKQVDVASVESMLSNCHLDDKQICPSLADFQFSNWNGEAPELPISFSDYAFDPNAEPQHLPSVEDMAEEIAHEHAENLDNGEDDNSGGFIDNSDVLSDAMSGDGHGTAEFIESAFSEMSNGTIGKLRQLLALEPSDYSYFNKILLRSWAGPAHWKMSNLPRNFGIGNKQQDKPQSKRQRKVPLRLTYDRPEADLDAKCAHCKTTAVTKATWSKYSKKKTTLPEDQQLDSQERLFKLFHKPHIVIKRQTGDSIGLDDEIENYDYSNKNDMDNFCPVVRDNEHDSSGDYSGAFDLSNETNFAPCSQSILSQQSAFSDAAHDGTVLTQDKLVAAPHRVQHVDIKYAKAAKRVDVKRLKSTMWNILSQESIPETSSKVPLPQMEQLAPSMKLPFKFDLLKDVLPTNVSTNMAKNLTIQTVFACLLYLTNEKVLQLSSTDCLDDIIIMQDPNM